jgi:hypothetical protein
MGQIGDEMTENERQEAIEALETIRAGLANPYDFAAPDFLIVPSVPIASGDGCHVFKLTPPINGVAGFILDEAAYPLHRATYQDDLKRALAIIQGWRHVQGERRRKAERDSRKRR